MTQRPVPAGWSWPVCIFVVLCTVALWLLMVARYQAFHPFNQDFTSFMQSLWHAVHYGTYDESVYRNQSLFTGHFAPVLLLLVPLMYAGPAAPVLLLAAQAAATGVAALFVYRLARCHLPPAAAIAVLGTFLFFPATQFATVFIFNPLVFGLPLLAAAFYRLYGRNDHRGFALLLIAAVTCQEIYCYLALLGGVLLWRRRNARTTAGVLTVAAPVLLLGLLLFFFPTVKSSPLFKDSREISSWWFGYLDSTATPGIPFTGASREFFSLPTAAYGATLLLPLLAIPLLAPEPALFTVAAALPYCLSAFTFTREIYSYYPVILLPSLFAALVLGLRRLASWLPRTRPAVTVAATGVLVATLAAWWQHSPFRPELRPFIYFPGIYANQRAPAIREALAHIPRTARVLAPPVLSERLFDCPQLDVIFTDNLLHLDYDYILADLYAYNWIVDIEPPFAPFFFQELRRLLAIDRYRTVFYRDGILLVHRTDSVAATLPPAVPDTAFAFAIRRALTIAGQIIPPDGPFLFTGMADWSYRHDHAATGTVRLPVCPGMPVAAGEPAPYRLTAGHVVLAAGEADSTTAFYFAAERLSEGAQVVTLTLGNDSVPVAYVIDRTPPLLTANLVPGPLWSTLTVTVSDTLSPVEVFWRTHNDTVWLTPPLIREWPARETTLNLYWPYPGGYPGGTLQRSLFRSRSGRTVTLTARDRAGNTARAALTVPGWDE